MTQCHIALDGGHCMAARRGKRRCKIEHRSQNMQLKIAAAIWRIKKAITSNAKLLWLFILIN